MRKYDARTAIAEWKKEGHATKAVVRRLGSARRHLNKGIAKAIRKARRLAAGIKKGV
nr:hypothetical protein [Candidatus Sigynarchaeota archaeon]